MTEPAATDASPPDLPPALRAKLSGYAWRRQTIGCSAAGVFRLEAEDLPALFLKVEPDERFAELPDEAARLRWLAAQDIFCPEVLALEVHAGHNWLLMTALAGTDLASSPDLPPAVAVGIMARALRDLHALDIRACPFDHRLDLRIALAGERLEAGAVDEEDFDDERQGRTAHDAFAELLARRPASENLVVTHGDACTPNLIADGGRFIGFIDLSRLGVADRHQDLALACRSIADNFGPLWVARFLAVYGPPEADAEKLSYYQLLDEFF